jgi:hypothetical protein
MTQAFYQPNAATIIDFAIERGGILRGGFSNETLEQIQARYPGAVLGDLEAFIATKEARLRTEPTPITAEQWMEALEVLPPMKWTGHAGAESFMCAEMFSGRVTDIYCRLIARGSQHYYTFRDVVSLTHEQIVARCEAKLREEFDLPSPSNKSLDN